MSNVINIDQWLIKQGRQPVNQNHSTASKQKEPGKFDAQIISFAPMSAKLNILRNLVYNEPSVLDSYYIMYPDSVDVSRYYDCVILRDSDTGERILTVYRINNAWYCDVAPNVPV